MFDSYTSESMSDLTPEKAEELQAYYDKGAGMDLKAQEDYELEAHWACGKFNCDCDEQTDNAMTNEYYAELEAERDNSY